MLLNTTVKFYAPKDVTLLTIKKNKLGCHFLARNDHN